MPASTPHVLGSATFGIGFVFLTVGCSELFMENVLPVVAAVSWHCAKRSVIVLAAIPGVLGPEALQAAGDLVVRQATFTVFARRTR